MRQYSPSSVGSSGPPTFVTISMPSAVTERTIRPRVSTWAHSPTLRPSSRPGTVMTRLPLFVRRVPNPSSRAMPSAAVTTFSVKPVGLSCPSSVFKAFVRKASRACSCIAVCAIFSTSVRDFVEKFPVPSYRKITPLARGGGRQSPAGTLSAIRTRVSSGSAPVRQNIVAPSADIQTSALAASLSGS